MYFERTMIAALKFIEIRNLEESKLIRCEANFNISDI